MTPADMALALFTACNSVRILAYLPQILRVGRDTNGATAISYTTWVLFGFSHLSTAGYALLVVSDPLMAAVFVGNAACCLIILGLTAYKRAVHARAASEQPRGGHPQARLGFILDDSARPQHTRFTFGLRAPFGRHFVRVRTRPLSRLGKRLN